MAMRVCAEHGCPTLVKQGTRDGRCATHRRARDKARGSRQERGYDAAHTKLRQAWVRKVSTGTVKCWRCGKRIAPDEPFDLGHDDQDRTKYRGAECIKCNRGTATRR